MRAIMIDDRGLRLETHRPSPQPAEGEALVRPRKCGVGFLDLAAARGRGQFRGVMGHEFVGVVEAVDGGDSARLAGKRVVGSVSIVCSRCDMCLAGLKNHCRTRTAIGLIGRDGCLADRFTIPAVNLVVVPDSLDDDHAVFAQPLASAIQAARQLAIEGKPYVTVLGDGVSGLLAAQVLARLNASVRLLGHHADNLALCEKWSVKHRLIDEVGRRADQDIVVDCTGTADGLSLAMQLVRPRGQILLKTLPDAQQTSGGPDLSPAIEHELELIGSRDGSIVDAVSMLARREVDVISLISRRMSLNDGPAIFKAAAQPGTLKVVVDL